MIRTSYGSKNAASIEKFESLQFVLADPMSKNGANCLQYRLEVVYLTENGFNITQIFFLTNRHVYFCFDLSKD